MTQLKWPTWELAKEIADGPLGGDSPPGSKTKPEAQDNQAKPGEDELDPYQEIRKGKDRK
jgi:hypothetical protein